MKRFLTFFFSIAALVAVHAQSIPFKPYKHWNERLAAFAKEPPITSSDIVMLGDSHTEKAGDWHALLRTTGIRNRGIISDVAAGVYERLDPILKGKPKAIFFLIGANDVSHNLTPKQVFDDICRVVEKIKKDSPTTKIYLESLLPFVVGSQRWKTLEGKEDCMPAINAMLMDYCKANDVGFVNLYPRFVKKGTKTLRLELSLDELHINRLGYKIWAHEIAPIIKKLQHK